MDYRNLANQLFFAKEAAEYLNISVQRLNQLVHDGKIIPLKKNASGTIFHIDELKKRKEELAIFKNLKLGGELGMFEINTRIKQEAVNFSTLMIAKDMTENALEPQFEEFAKKVDVTLPLVDLSLINAYVKYFNVPELNLKKTYEDTVKAFSKLRPTDEIIKRGESDYPPLLAKTKEAPRFLYIRGNKALLFEKRTVALVGSRKASEEAKRNTRNVAATLGRNGITVVSGLAKGIDVTAHQSALERGYNTISVIGTNLNQYYPAENRAVQEEIERKGLIVSQFSPASKTQRWFFPLRNGVMSGLSLATVIMEAGETSGALKQARDALKQGRQVLIPRNALEIETITWPKKFVEKGAEVVSTPRQIIEKLAKNKIFDTEINEQTSLTDYMREISNAIDSETGVVKL